MPKSDSLIPKDVEAKFDAYPPAVKPRMLVLRELVLSVANRIGVGELDESLKWGEPSYLAKGGSAIRMDWKSKTPDECFLFFRCQTKLVDTFRELYSEVLEFRGNRALVLQLGKPLPEREVAHCIELAHRYQSLKNLPLLGC